MREVFVGAQLFQLQVERGVVAYGVLGRLGVTVYVTVYVGNG